MRSGINKVAVAIGVSLSSIYWENNGLILSRFDMMGKRVYKTYVNLTNIIIRISDGTPAGKEHAILVNAHLDSTLPSPGAADDGLAVGVMLDVMRVLINTPDWSPKHSIVLCKSIYHISHSILLKCLQYSTMRKNHFKTARIFFPRSTQLHQRVSFSKISLKLCLTKPSVRAVINLEGVYLSCHSVGVNY